MSKITDFCIEECIRQNDNSTQSVASMVEGWCYAIGIEPDVCLFQPDIIEELGHIVKSSNTGFRTTPVSFKNGDKGLPYDQIERTLKNLCDAVWEHNIGPDEFYTEFEKIHPFEDGNGRVGAILWNILRGNVENPVIPPDFFSGVQDVKQ